MTKTYTYEDGIEDGYYQGVDDVLIYCKDTLGIMCEEDIRKIREAL